MYQVLHSDQSCLQIFRDSLHVTARDFYSSVIHWVGGGGGGGGGAALFIADADCSNMDSYLYKYAGAHQFLTH